MAIIYMTKQMENLINPHGYESDEISLTEARLVQAVSAAIRSEFPEGGEHTAVRSAGVAIGLAAFDLLRGDRK